MEISKGPRLALSDTEADRFQATFRESNKKVAIQFFGGAIEGSDDPLFIPRSAAMEPAVNHSLNLERAIEIAAALLKNRDAHVEAGPAARPNKVGKRQIEDIAAE